MSLKKPSDFFYVKNLDLIDSIQVNLNILDTRVFELGIEKECKRIILQLFLEPRLVLVFLTGKINAYHYFPENDHRSLWGNAQKNGLIIVKNSMAVVFFQKKFHKLNFASGFVCLFKTF